MTATTQTQDFTDRLQIHINALPEAFELLSRASTPVDLARHFSRVIRGLLTTVEMHFFHKPSDSSSWVHLYGKGEAGHERIELVPLDQVCRIVAFTEGSFSIGGTQPLCDGSHFGLLLGRKLDEQGYSDVDRLSLQMYLQPLASAYQALLGRKREKGLAFSLSQRLLQLNSVIDTGIALSAQSDDSVLLPLALSRAAALTNASRAELRVNERNRLRVKYTFPEGAQIRAARQHTSRIQSRFRFAGLTYSLTLYEKESRTGTDPFDETDQTILDAITRQVRAAIENRYFHQQELERQKTEQDLAIAASIQQRILPAALPNIAGYEVAGMNTPTKSVGGDYYDCIPLPDGRYALIVGDVAGKGVPASLLVSSFHASLAAYLEGNYPILDLTRKLNGAMYRASTDDRYITAFFALLSPDTGEIEILNAGHNPAYLVRANGTIDELGDGGLALGMLDLELPYSSGRYAMGAGDRLLVYSDGVTEAMNESKEQYDIKRSLKEFALAHRALGAQEFIETLMADIQDFVGDAPQSDDITALFLIRK